MERIEDEDGVREGRFYVRFDAAAPAGTDREEQQV
jgi:hypothetical protein